MASRCCTYPRLGFQGLVRVADREGADVNAKNKDGITPLHEAAMGHKNIAKLLIDKGGT